MKRGRNRNNPNRELEVAFRRLAADCLITEWIDGGSRSVEIAGKKFSLRGSRKPVIDAMMENDVDRFAVLAANHAG